MKVYIKGPHDPGGREARRQGCTCSGRYEYPFVVVDRYCPLGHGEDAWGYLSDAEVKQLKEAKEKADAEAVRP